jgi:hypothetical protein
VVRPDAPLKAFGGLDHRLVPFAHGVGSGVDAQAGNFKGAQKPNALT